MFPKFSIHTILQQQKPSTINLKTQHLAQEGIQLHEATKDVLQSSFICGIIGSPGAGKSSIVETMLQDCRFYNGKFQRVLFVGPTKYRNLVQDAHNTKKVLDIGWIYRQIQDANKWQCRSMLIVMDDIVASMRSCHSVPGFIDLFFNRRHLLQYGTISFFVTSQKFNLLPTFIRGCLNMLIIFPLGRLQLETLVRQLSLDIPKKTLVNLFSTLKKYQFYYINCVTNRLYNNKWVQV